jgi:hypothetical protein
MTGTMQIDSATQVLGINLEMVREQVAQAQHQAIATPAASAPTADVVLTLSSAAQQLLAAHRAEQAR